jgi:tetratricopeptide (TPR) repeat protein
MSGFRKYFHALLLALFLSLTSPATGQELLNKDQQDKILEKISQLLIDNYVIQNIGEACAAYLEKQREEQRYVDITHPRAFANRLTSDLREIHHDQHIRILAIPPEDKRLIKKPKLDFFLRTRDKIKENLGFKEVKILVGNVGYINLDSFEPYELARDKALTALHFIENTDAIIIDLRDNLGGNPTMVQYLCSYFFDTPVHLNSIYWRRGNYTEEFWSMDSIGVKKRPNVPLFILTSDRTFSGGEEFAYDLKINKRATLIGEKTAGGANPGYTFHINDYFSIFIPTGRSINPVTGTNWEGKGVEPDITIQQSKALSLALEKAEHAARIYREKADDQAVMSYLRLCADFDLMDTLIVKGDSDSARSVIERTLQNAVKYDLLNEWMINDLGYTYMSKHNAVSALALFQFNVKKYPDSFNVYDSLGEAYMTFGDKKLAIDNYKKSLILNPRNENAKYMLKKLETEIDQGLHR